MNTKKFEEEQDKLIEIAKAKIYKSFGMEVIPSNFTINRILEDLLKEVDKLLQD